MIASLIRIAFCTFVVWLSWLVLRSCWRKLPSRPEQRWYEPSFERTEPKPDDSIAPFRDEYAELYEVVMDEAMQQAAKLLEGYQDRTGE